MSAPELVQTISGNGFPNVYVYEYRGVRFGTAKTWRSYPSGWNVSERVGDAWRESFDDRVTPQTRAAAIALAVAAIDARHVATASHAGRTARVIVTTAAVTVGQYVEIVSVTGDMLEVETIDGGRVMLMAGDVVPFVTCACGDDVDPAERAAHATECDAMAGAR